MQLLLLFLTLSTTIPFISSSENEIYSYTATPFSLTKTSPSLNFEWKNHFNYSDIILTFSKATGYTSSIYLYDDKDKLKSDMKNNNFTNSIWNSSITSKINIISSPSTILRQIYYIFIHDPNGFFYSDTLTIFNEQDTKALQANIPYEILTFGGQRKLSVEFDIDRTSIGKLFIVNENQTQGNVNITLSLNNVSNVVNFTTEPLFEFTFNENLDQKGRFILTFNEIFRFEKGNKINVLLIYEYEDKMRLHHEISEVNYFLQNVNYLYYYVDISDYAYEQFNIISFEFTQGTLNDKLLKGIYTKILNTNNTSEAYLKSLMPSQGSDFLIKNSTMNDRVYHIYFNRTLMHTSNEPSTVILIAIELNNDLSYRKPDYVKATLSKRIQYETSYSFPSSKQIDFKLLDYVPRVIRFNISNINADFSYVLYTSGQSIMTTYNGTVLTSQGINTKKTTNQIFVISKNGGNTLSTFDIIFFGQQQVVKFEIITTRSDVMYFNSYRPTKTISKQLTSCNEPFYIIGSYSSPYSSYMYLHPIFGEFTLYYKNYSSIMQDMLLGKQLFPTDAAYAVNSNTIAYPEGIMDVIGVKCEYPGWFNLYMMYYSLPDAFKSNSQTANYIAKSETKMIEFPESKNVETNWKIEINEVIDKEIKYTIGNETIVLNKDNKKYQKEISSNDCSMITVEPSSYDNVIHFTIANKSLQYETISDEGIYANNSNNMILFQLKQNMNYQQIKINITPLGYHSFMYMKQSFPNELTVPYPSNSNIDIIKISNELNLLITNPYALTHNANDSVYYVLFQHSGNSAYDNKTIQIEYVPPFDIDTYNESSILTVYDYNTIIGINKNDSKDNNIYIIVDVCDVNMVNQKELVLSYYNTTLNEFHIGNKYNMFSSKNYEVDMNLHFENYVNSNERTNNESQYNGIHLSYFYANNYNTELFDEDISPTNLNLDIHGDKLQWNKMKSIKEENVAYTVYVFSNNSNMQDYFNNSCYLASLNNSNDNDIVEIGTTKKNSYKLSMKNISVNVNVIAHIKTDLLNIDVVYNARMVTPQETANILMGLLIGGGVALVVIIIIIIAFVILSKKKQISVPNIASVDKGELLNENENTFSKDEFDKA